MKYSKEYDTNTDIQKKDIHISDIFQTFSLCTGFSFLIISFYHSTHMLGNTIIGFIFLAYALISINKWEYKTVQRIKFFKWFPAFIYFFVIPLQIYLLISSRNLDVLYIIAIINFLADLFVIIFLRRKRKLLEGSKDSE